jgi:hypothetical protein
MKKCELKLERERKERERKRQKEAHKREIARAKEKYERLLESEAKYRKYYYDAYSQENRKYWWNKLKEIDEARSEYLRLENK